MWTVCWLHPLVVIDFELIDPLFGWALGKQKKSVIWKKIYFIKSNKKNYDFAHQENLNFFRARLSLRKKGLIFLYNTNKL